MLFMAIVATVAVSVLFGGTYASTKSTLASLEDKRTKLANKIHLADNKVLELEVERDKKQNEVVLKETGLDFEMIRQDVQSAESYFKQAFTWSNGGEYDRTRDEYIKSLGKDNSFTKSYLPENIKIDTDDGDLSYIDANSLKSMFSNMSVTPMASEGDSIRYTAIVEYYVYTSEKDINNLDALAPSNAIIMFTVSKGDDGRTVGEVKAWNGTSTVNEK